MSAVSRILTRVSSAHRPANPSPSLRLRNPAHAARLRYLHAPQPNPRSGSGLSVATVFTILAAIGVGATAYGVYTFRNPVFVRSP